MRKLLTFLCAALMSVGMYAATVVTITEADLPSSGRVLTKDGVTLITGVLVTDPADPEYGNIYQGGTLSTDLGNFVSIEVQASELTIQAMDGWTGDSKNMTWTGSASEVTFIGNVVTFGEGFTITCTIEEPEPEPEPAEVTVVFAANSKTVEKTVPLPHEFVCSYYNRNGELDAIIQELYGISGGRCCDYIYPVASGNEAVSAGSYGDDNYIAISAAFEGTATVSGRYWNWDAYDGDGDWMDYSLTISIKGDEPEPTPATYTLQLVADPEKGSVAVTNLLGSNIVDNGNGNYTVPENAEVTILATPNEGYEFAGWKVGNIDDMVGCYYCGTALNTKDNPMTITMTEDKAYLAEFEATASEDVDITPNADPDHAGVYYSTFYDSQIKYALPAGVEAYVATRDGANLLLSKIAAAGQTIPADNAVIFKSSVTPFTLTPSDAEAVPVNAINSLQGTDVSIATPDNCYVLAGNDGVGFYHYTASMLNPHKAYVIYSGSNQAPKRMPFIFDQATGVEEVGSETVNTVRSEKILRNGQLYIIKNGVKYNAIGQMVK